MTIVRRPSPFGELMSLRPALDRLFEDRPVDSSAHGLNHTPAEAGVWS
jgi:hypothetical protein